MTDDEIDEILIPEFARYLWCEDGDLMVIRSERIAYRTGMRRAARIAREHEFARTAADAIERAASDEPPAA